MDALLIKTLALSDGWTVGMIIAQMVLNLAMAMAMFYLREKTKELNDFRGQVRAQAEQLIDAKFAAVSERVQNTITRLEASVETINQRLERGDGEFDHLSERDQKHELILLQRITELKDSVRDHCAKAGDLRRVEDQVHKIELALAAGRREENRT